MKRLFAQHLAALRDALRRLAGAPLNTLLSLIVIGSALALPCAGAIVLDNLRHVLDTGSGVQQISVFMQLDAERKILDGIEDRLRQSTVGRWVFVSRADALKRLQASEGMGEIVASLPKNPLPDAFVIEPNDPRPEALEQLAETLRSWPGVAHVQLDSAWVKRFDAFLNITRLALVLLAGLFAGALIAVTFNTIRLQILAGAAEIEVARLIGATDAFIRRPFVYFGTLQGASGGLFAALLVGIGEWLLADPVDALIALYGGHFVLHGLNAGGVAALIGLGGGLGWLGAQLSLAIHVRRIG